jgi:hypothetical protein
MLDSASVVPCQQSMARRTCAISDPGWTGSLDLIPPPSHDGGRVSCCRPSKQHPGAGPPRPRDRPPKRLLAAVRLADAHQHGHCLARPAAAPMRWSRCLGWPQVERRSCSTVTCTPRARPRAGGRRTAAPAPCISGRTSAGISPCPPHLLPLQLEEVNAGAAQHRHAGRTLAQTPGLPATAQRSHAP